MASPRPSRLVFALGLAAIFISACSRQQEGETKDQRLSRANEYFAANQYEKAETEYRHVLRLDPVETTALSQLGTIYFAQGQLRPALSLLKKSAELQPDDPDVQRKLGQIYAAAGANKEARETLLAILEHRPGDEDALITLADTATTPDDIRQMEATIQTLRDQDKDRAGYHVALGELAMRRKDQAAAEVEFKAAVALEPQSSVVNLALGNLAWSRNDLKAAEQAFKKASELAPLRSYRRLKYVDFKLRTGDRAGAKSILEDIRRQAPDDLPVAIYLMKLACGEGRKDDCSQSMQAILKQDPENFDALLIEGGLSLAAGNVAKALQQFELLNRINDRNPQARLQLAMAYLLNEQNDAAIDKAVNSLNIAVSVDPHFNPAKMLLSDLRIRKGQYAGAIELLSPVISEQPQIAQAHYLLARAYQGQQNRAKALAIYRQMTELFPKDPQPPFLAGLLLLDQRQMPDARKAFEKALEIAPEYLPAMEKLVDVDMADKQYASALDRVQTQIDKNPKLAQPWAVRGKIYLAQRDFVHAEPDLLKAIELEPDLEGAYILLAGLYVALNRQQEAIDKLTAFTDKNKDVPTLMQLATIHEQLKHYEAASAAYEKLLTVNPKYFPALNNLAYIYSEHLGRLDEAYALAQRAREVLPDEPHTADTMGWILFKKGEYANAQRLLQESAAKRVDEPEVQFHLGMAQYMLGDEAGARAALQKAANATKDFTGKEEARQRLEILAIDPKTADPAARSELDRYLRERPSDPEALVRLASLQARDGATDQAVKTYEKIVDAYPQFAPATLQLARLYGERSVDDQKAYDLVTKARQVYPEDAELAKTLGVMNYRRKYYTQSAELLKQASATRPDDAELQYYLGMSYYQLKQPAEATEPLQYAISLNLSPKLADEARRTLDDPELTKARGLLDYRRGDFKRSAQLLKQAAERRADDPELLFYLGMSYYQLKQPADAKGPLQRAAGMNLPPKLVDEATRALADCCKGSK